MDAEHRQRQLGPQLSIGKQLALFLAEKAFPKPGYIAIGPFSIKQINPHAF